MNKAFSWKTLLIIAIVCFVLKFVITGGAIGFVFEVIFLICLVSGTAGLIKDIKSRKKNEVVENQIKKESKSKNVLIALCILVGILIIVILYAVLKPSEQPQQEALPTVITNSSPTIEPQPKVTKTKYPIGSYSVSIEQTGGANSNIPLKISVDDANTGSNLANTERDIKPWVEDYVYFMFYAQKVAKDTISVNCSKPDTYYPVNIKSSSSSNLWVPPNPNNDPKLDTSISMYLEKNINDISFICIPR